MGLRGWIKRLERDAGPLHGTLRLPDGTEISYQREELFDALLAAVDGREHRLLPYLRQAEPERSEGMPGLIRAIEGNGEGDHDDLVLSVALACWAGERYLGRTAGWTAKPIGF